MNNPFKDMSPESVRATMSLTSELQEFFKSDDYCNKMMQLYLGEPLSHEEFAATVRKYFAHPQKHNLADLMVKQDRGGSAFERYTVDVPDDLCRYKMTQSIMNGATPKTSLYLGEFLNDLGDNVIVDKTCTGCGGTTLALNQTGKDIIIAMPTRNTVESKELDELGEKRDDIFVIHGGLNNSREAVWQYLTSCGRTKKAKKSGIEWKNIKIVCTHEILGKLAEWLRGADKDGYPISERDPYYFNDSVNKDNYHLYIDEMHSLLSVGGSDNLRRIHKMLNYAKTLQHVVFITATMMDEEYFPKEIIDMASRLKVVKINFPAWSVYVPKIETLVCKPNGRHTPSGDMAAIIKTNYLSATNDGENAHIFINSVNDIVTILRKIKWLENINDIRIVCSNNANDNEDKFFKAFKAEYSKDDVTETAALNMYLEREKPLTSPITSPVCKVNFYTATAFAGCDIYDKDGQIYIISSKYKEQTMYDVATTIPQIIGRIRNYQKKYVYHIRDNGKGVMTMSDDEFEEELNDRIHIAKRDLDDVQQTKLRRDYAKGKDYFDEQHREYFVVANEKLNPITLQTETVFEFDDIACKSFKRNQYVKNHYCTFNMMRQEAHTLEIEEATTTSVETRIVNRTVKPNQRGTFKDKYTEYCALRKENPKGKRKLVLEELEKKARYYEIYLLFSEDELEKVYKWNYNAVCRAIRTKAVQHYKDEIIKNLKHKRVYVGAEISTFFKKEAEKWVSDVYGIEKFYLKDIYIVDSTSISRREYGKVVRYVKILGIK